jgi:nucleotide-binding universal stress UspA family protein
MNTSVSRPLEQEFVIFHPSDFSEASEAAFAHALKIALQAKARLEIMHVESHARFAEVGQDWLDFPGVRGTLARWGILPENVRRDEVAKTGVRVTKILAVSSNPVESMTREFETHRPDLIVLATHQRDGLARWMHKPVAEPLARKSGAMTLFVPRDGRGFVDLDGGNVRLKRVLIPIDHRPSPQIALDKASLFARGVGSVGVEFVLLHVRSGTVMPEVERPAGPGWSFEEIEREGNVVDEILKAESELRADLMVLATQGHADFLDALRGSTTERVLRSAHCPVLAVPAQA